MTGAFIVLLIQANKRLHSSSSTRGIVIYRFSTEYNESVSTPMSHVYKANPNPSLNAVNITRKFVIVMYSILPTFLIRDEVESHPICKPAVSRAKQNTSETMLQNRTGHDRAGHTQEVAPVLINELVGPILLEEFQRLQHIRHSDRVV